MSIAFLLFFLSQLCCFDDLQSVNVIYVGDSLRINAADVSRVTVSNSKVVKVYKEDGALVISARTRGSATLHLWKRGTRDPLRYSFTVMSAAVHKKVMAIRETLKGILGVKVSNAGENVYITGIVSKKEDLELIKKVSLSTKDVMNYVKLSDSMKQDEYNNLTNVLLDIGLYDVSIKKTENVMFVSASARTKKQVENAEHYLNINFPGGKFDIKVIPYQIDIDVKIVEMSSSMSRQMGLEMPSELSLTR
ncbi:MAG: pilus assembly protein N-terminal domain-containing protein, partial [bacterium]